MVPQDVGKREKASAEMTDREKLIALMVEAESLCAAIDCYDDSALCEYAGEVNGCAAFRADHLIANGVVVREKGEWMDNVDENGFLCNAWRKCSACGGLNFSKRPPFCPNCGADMRKGENE